MESDKFYGNLDILHDNSLWQLPNIRLFNEDKWKKIFDEQNEYRKIENETLTTLIERLTLFNVLQKEIIGEENLLTEQIGIITDVLKKLNVELKKSNK